MEEGKPHTAPGVVAGELAVGADDQSAFTVRAFAIGALLSFIIGAGVPTPASICKVLLWRSASVTRWAPYFCSLFSLDWSTLC